MSRDYQKFFAEIVEQWFMSEPLLFSVLCTHELRPNATMLCPMRTGHGRVEYRPQSLNLIEDSDIREMLRTEVIRIMLMHPYQRLPLNPDRVSLVIASDITISENGHVAYGMYTRENWVLSDGEVQLPVKGYFEEYYALIRERRMEQSPNKVIYDDITIEESGEDKVPGNSDIGGGVPPKGAPDAIPNPVKDDAADLWEPDDMTRDRVYRAIENALSERSRGTVSESLIEEIRSDRSIRINARRQLAMFHASVISSKRSLSRMRPNRRYGFEQMGVRHPYTTHLLIGIDTSESVQTKELSEFLGTINRLFKNGIEQIDLLFFDCELHLPVINMRHAKTALNVVGRGGTDFQPIVDYYESSDYDGLIVFTDGDADEPETNTTKKILWVLTDRGAYESSSLSPKIYIPH